MDLQKEGRKGRPEGKGTGKGLQVLNELTALRFEKGQVHKAQARQKQEAKAKGKGQSKRG